MGIRATIRYTLLCLCTQGFVVLRITIIETTIHWCWFYSQSGIGCQEFISYPWKQVGTTRAVRFLWSWVYSD